MHRSAGDWLERVDIVTEVENETGPESKAYGTLCFGFLGLNLGGRELRWTSYFLGGRGWSAWAFRYHRAGDGTSSKHVCGRTGVLGGGSRGGAAFYFLCLIPGACCRARLIGATVTRHGR